MAKGSKDSKGSPDKKSKGSKGSPNKKDKGSPDKKSKKSEEAPPLPPEKPIREIDLHPNLQVRDTNIHWLSGPGFTFIINKCYTKDQSLMFRDFFNLPLWDWMTLDATLDEYCRSCIHQNCKDWPHSILVCPEEKVINKLMDFWALDLPMWDYLHVEEHLDEYDRDCCPQRNITNIKHVDLASVPDGPKYVNTFNLRNRPKTILKPIPPSNLGVGYTYLRDLGLREEYYNAIVKEIQKTYLPLKKVNSVDEGMIKRGTLKQKLGMVISIMPGPHTFVIFVIRGTAASAAKLEFADQILEVDGLPMNNKLALGRLTENESVVINFLYTKCPFKLYYNFSVPKGDSMGFQIVDGNIIYVEKDSSAEKVGLPLNYQIIELNKDCIVGLTNTELKRDIRSRAEVSPGRKITMTVIPRCIYHVLTRNLDMAYIRNRAFNENYKVKPVIKRF